MTPIPGIDYDALDRLSGGKPDLAAELIDLFAEELKQRMGEIEQALSDQDLGAVEALAHRLAGGAAFCAAQAIKEVCLQLEMKASSNNASGAHADASQLRSLAERFTEHAGARVSNTSR